MYVCVCVCDMCMYVCVCVCACMCVCMYVCMYMYVCGTFTIYIHICSFQNNIEITEYEIKQDEDDDLPFACFICRQGFTNPVVTR